jgi:alkylation response protein AidB-like acyl-CoA dehydrogenase
VDFEPSDDQRAVQQELRRFLEARVTAEARMALAAQADTAAGAGAGAVDRELWQALGDLGVFGLRLGEDGGGVGLGLAEAVIVFEELGRVAAPGPLIATHLAAGLVGGAAAGGTVVGLLPAGDASDTGDTGDAVGADRPVLVEHLDGLDVLLVVGPGGVDRIAPAASVGATPVERPVDPLTPVHLLDAVPAGERIAGPDVARRLRADGALLAAAMQVGLAEAAVGMGTAYAQQRHQFGRPIGSFQAVKHLLADAQVAVEIARAAVHAAAVTADDGSGGSGDAGDPRAGARAVPAARIVASRAAHRATTANIQVHGGMGYTWELDAHLFLKRSMVLDVALGPAEAAIDELAAAL